MGGVSFEKAGKLFGGKENRTFSMRSFSFPQTPNLSWQRPKGKPLWKPQTYVFFYFLFLLLVVISFGYLAIYTNILPSFPKERPKGKPL